MQRHSTTKSAIPAEGVTIAAAPGEEFTRVQLDVSQEGISLAMVGAAASALRDGEQHMIHLKKADEGIILAMVGAASAAKRS